MKNKLVILCGAGFPLMWGAPMSSYLLSLVKNTIHKYFGGNTSISNKLTANDSFEIILSVIESMLYYGIKSINNDYTTTFYECKEKVESDILWKVYCRCINLIIKEVEKYECRILQDENTMKNIRDFWDILNTEFKSVNFYTTNYDEILPYIFKREHDIFDFKSHSISKNTFSNLHGSIHLSLEFISNQYEIVHNDIIKLYDNALEIYGGNPNELIIFSPIIIGKNKSQRILDKHFNQNIVTFANDLNQCSTLLIIGYSFSDNHINMLLKQFIQIEKCKVVIIDKTDKIDNSDFERNFNNVFFPKNKYTPDTHEDHWFSYSSPDLSVYKRGCDHIFTDTEILSHLIK